MYADSYSVNTANYLKRKKNFEQRITAITNYINTITACRSKLIAAYFNATADKACAICDNCINEKALTISKEEFELISSGILQLVKDTPLPVKYIQQQLKGIKKEKLWKVINYLQAENKIAVNKEGNIFI
jgi:ATP-dependent DNA helicase RecQ